MGLRDGLILGLRDEGEEKVGFAEKKLRLWGIDAIDTIDAIDAIEGVEEIVWGIFLNRGTSALSNFFGVCGGMLKEMKATLMLRKESLHLSFETNGYIPMQPINSTTQGNLD